MNSNKIIIYTLLAFLLLISHSFATTYYVKSDGNDQLDGRSDATAWKTISKVNGFRFSSGDDVYFKCNNTWPSEQLVVDWGGTSGNRAEIGAYYGSSTIGVSGTRPTINGNNYAPSDGNSGLVHVNSGVGYVTIRNIILENSNGMGIRYYKGEDNGLVDNVKISHCYRQGVDFDTSDNCILENSEITDTNNLGNGACVKAEGSDGCIVRYNKIHESSGWSEGVNALKSYNMQIIGNLIYDTRAAGIYLDHAQGTVIKNNLIYYSKDTKYWRYLWPDNAPSDGIWVSDEKAEGLTDRSSNLTIAYNIVIGARNGFLMSRNATTDCGLINTKIIHNTFIAPRSTGKAIIINKSNRHSNSVIKNNIFYQPDGQIADVAANSELTFENNLWSQSESDVDVDARGNNDVYGKDPKFLKADGWHDLSSGEISGNEFSLQGDSPAVNRGLDLGDLWKDGISPNSTWPNKVIFKKQYDYDDWEIGAIIYTDGDGNTDDEGINLPSPTNLKISQ